MDRVLASHDVLEGGALAGLDKVVSAGVQDRLVDKLFRFLFWPRDM